MIAQRFDTVVSLMTADEARASVAQINSHMNSARALLLDLYERRGWAALGYQSWRECVTAEFEQSQAYLYRQLQAAEIERRISPIGEIGVVPDQSYAPRSPHPNGATDCLAGSARAERRQIRRA